VDLPEAERTLAIRNALARHEKKFSILRKEDIPDKNEEANIEDITVSGGRGWPA
jgi:hypothetical protein